MTQTTENERALVPLELTALGGEQGSRGAGEQGSRREYGVTFIRAGRVRQRDGQPARLTVPAGVLREAAHLLNGRAVFLDHAGFFDYPSLRNLAGVTSRPQWNEVAAGIDGFIRLYDSETGRLAAELLDGILADQMAGREVPDVGLSLVFFHEWEADDSGQITSTRITHIESCDLVFGPAAEGRVKEMLSKFNLSPDPSPERGGEQGERSPLPAIGQAERSPNNVISAGSSALTPTLSQRERGQEGERPAEQLTAYKGGSTMEPNEVQEQVQLNSETPATPPAQPAAQPQGDVMAALRSLQEEVGHLRAALGRQEEPQVVQGLGQAPRGQGSGAGVQGMATGIERFAPTIDWLFGVKDAPYPDPQFRRADMIYQALTGDWEWRGLFNPDRVMLAGANVTDLPDLAVNAMNKVIVLAWAGLSAYRWYEQVAAVVPNDGSTHPMSWIGVGGIEVLPVVAEKGTYTELSLADTREEDSFVKYGGYVGITLEMFRRSEIAKIQAVPQGLARSAVMKRSANIAALFTANAGVGPTLDQDSKALFHDDHGNVATTAFDATGWAAVDLAIWTQAELGSTKPLGISPKFWLGPRALYASALAVFGYGDGMPTSYNVWAQERGLEDPRPVPLAVPDFSDATDWAAVVDPKVFPVIMMSYAQGGQGGAHPLPELYAVTNETQGLVFTNDVLPIKCRDWYAYGVNGYRGIAKRNVA